ncbi:MAG TPA: aminotransferase class I/II-fold pyridoxal phosphate-dependent enzyme [Anaerolineae bacterium]|nr:aminotransferase class I/II-fold pyridoxal phosphate-dependent enzyme [Anaerolineae bacterium]HQK13074.1 aminotransferase class I/II-fold pyridoxal phosphate-dependent enzyme [Anaerolineae bacterium]
MPYHISTQAVHAGEEKRKPFGALTTPIYQTSTYTFEDTADVLAFMERKAERKAAREAGGDLPLRDEYGRYSNPTQLVVERKLAALEGGERALLFASGMNAITTTFLALLAAGDHVIVVADCYRRTREFAEKFLPRWGVETTLVPVDDLQALTAAIRPNTRLIFTETPTNPYLRIADLPRIAEIARPRGIITAVDSTFATPINMQPLAFGIDLVLHSATKYLGGHNDILAGVVIGAHRLLAKIEDTRGLLGGVGGPHDAYLLLRGLKTLELRVRRQNENGMRVAQFLEQHPAIARVYYPGLPSHPDYATAQRLMTGFGGVVSFEVAGDKETTSHFVDRLQMPYIGPTLGGVEGIVQQQALFVSLDPAERAASGVGDTLVRYALGIEDAEDIIADLAQALER